MRRETESGDESPDPAMECIIRLEEKRLGRCLKSQELDVLVRRFSSENRLFLKPTNQREAFTPEQAARKRRN
jgi:hypothetical protein